MPSDADRIRAFEAEVKQLTAERDARREELRVVLAHVVDLRAEIKRLKAELERANNPTWERKP